MSASDLAALLNTADITPGEIRRAVHHMPKPLRAALYDETSPLHRSAAGEFFEALIYEMLLFAGENAPEIISIAAKLSDAVYIPYDKHAPDGLWYSRDGGIRFKVRGRIAAEIDFLVMTAGDVLVFGEVIINPSGAGRFAAEIAKKRTLLEQLYGVQTEFILVMPAAPQERLRCLGERDSYAVVFGGDEAYSRVPAAEVVKRNLSPAASSKRIDGRQMLLPAALRRP